MIWDEFCFLQETWLTSTQVISKAIQLRKHLLSPIKAPLFLLHSRCFIPHNKQMGAWRILVTATMLQSPTYKAAWGHICRRVSNSSSSSFRFGRPLLISHCYCMPSWGNEKLYPKSYAFLDWQPTHTIYRAMIKYIWLVIFSKSLLSPGQEFYKIPGDSTLSLNIVSLDQRHLWGGSVVICCHS